MSSSSSKGPEGQCLSNRRCTNISANFCWAPPIFPLPGDISLDYPQQEIKVWLHGRNIPCDVTFRHSIACTSPFMFCIGFDPEDRSQLLEGSVATLRFEENSGRRNLLGEIEIKLKTILPAEDHTDGSL